MPFGTEFVSMLSPPGEGLGAYDPTKSPSEQPDSIPTTFIEAMSIREQVFVKEQGVALENELDEDDRRSYHWVVYASVGTTQSPEPSHDAAGPASHSHGHSGHHHHGHGNHHHSRNAEERRQSSSTAQRVAVGTIRLVPPPHPPHQHPLPVASANSASSANPPASDSHVGQAPQGHADEPFIKLGRLAVLPQYRGLGLSRLLVNAALNYAQAHQDSIMPSVEPAEAEKLRLEGKYVPDRFLGLVLVHAQQGVVGLWESLGFARDPKLGEWDEEGILHVGMWRRIRDLKEKGPFGS